MRLENVKKGIRGMKVDVPNILMTVFALCVLLHNLLPIPGIAGNGLIAASGCAMFLYTVIRRRNDKKVWYVTGLAAILSVCMLASAAYNHNAGLTEVLWIWCYMGAALLLCSFEIDDRWISLLFYLLSAYYFVCIVMHRSVHYILYSTSRNSIPLLMHFLLFLLYICRGSKKKVLYLPAAFSVIVSVWSLSRAGVLTSVFFMVCICVYGLVKDKKSWKRLLGTACLLAVSLVLLVKVFPTNVTVKAESNEVHEELDSDEEEGADTEVAKKQETIKTRFSTYGLKSVRTSIWAEYISGSFSSGKNFLLGVDCSTGTFLSKYRQPHNSYLELHAKFGFTGFLITVILLAGTFIRLCREKKGLYLIIFVTCGIRGMFDWVAFPGCIDVMFWFFCFQEMFRLGKGTVRTGDGKLFTESAR